MLRDNDECGGSGGGSTILFVINVGREAGEPRERAPPPRLWRPAHPATSGGPTHTDRTTTHIRRRARLPGDGILLTRP